MLNRISIPVKVFGSGQNEAYINPLNNSPENKETAFKGFESAKQERYNHIYNHELAHQQTGGAQSGGITINKDSNGVAFEGHVPIKIPGLNKDNPTESKKMAQVAFRAALAPGDPSSQDYAVAALAQSKMSEADSFISKNKQNGNPFQGKQLNIIA